MGSGDCDGFGGAVPWGEVDFVGDGVCVMHGAASVFAGGYGLCVVRAGEKGGDLVVIFGQGGELYGVVVVGFLDCDRFDRVFLSFGQGCPGFVCV